MNEYNIYIAKSLCICLIVRSLCWMPHGLLNAGT